MDKVCLADTDAIFLASGHLQGLHTSDQRGFSIDVAMP